MKWRLTFCKQFIAKFLFFTDAGRKESPVIIFDKNKLAPIYGLLKNNWLNFGKGNGLNFVFYHPVSWASSERYWNNQEGNIPSTRKSWEVTIHATHARKAIVADFWHRETHMEASLWISSMDRVSFWVCSSSWKSDQHDNIEMEKTIKDFICERTWSPHHYSKGNDTRNFANNNLYVRSSGFMRPSSLSLFPRKYRTWTTHSQGRPNMPPMNMRFDKRSLLMMMQNNYGGFLCG